MESENLLAHEETIFCTALEEMFLKLFVDFLDLRAVNTSS